MNVLDENKYTNNYKKERNWILYDFKSPVHLNEKNDDNGDLKLT